jgi:short-subunit dehydrogenase
MTNYSATKAYVISFSVGLAEEVRESGVMVSVLCPGPTFTGFQERAGIRENPMLKLVFADSRVVARAGYEGLMAGKAVIIPGFFNRMSVLLSRIGPLSVTARFLKKFREPGMKPIVRKLP